MEILAQAGTGLLLLLVGGAAGALVAGGVVALTVGLGITERFIGITHTAKRQKALKLPSVWGAWPAACLPYIPRRWAWGKRLLRRRGCSGGFLWEAGLWRWRSFSMCFLYSCAGWA